MNKEKKPYVPAPKDVPAPDLDYIYSSKPEGSEDKNHRNGTNSPMKNTKSLNNANISRTNLDTELIDINADGDSDESKYDDLI